MSVTIVARRGGARLLQQQQPHQHPTCRPQLRCTQASPSSCSSWSPFARATNHDRYPQRHTFVSNPFASSVQKLEASRIIDGPPRVIYDVVSDVGAYSNYIPYCLTSRVTKTSRPAEADGKQYPEEAQLVIGFGDSVRESFWSRVYCAPHEVIETVCGPATETTLTEALVKHHSPRPVPTDDPTRSAGVLAHLLTRWTFRELGGQTELDGDLGAKGQTRGTKTEVRLVIEYQFSNPMYAVLSQAVAPKVADKMIEAFETRVRNVLKG